MFERRFNPEEPEKVSQEGEADLNVAEEMGKGKSERVESGPLEEGITQGTAELEKSAEDNRKSLEGLGGVEGVRKVMSGMSAVERSQLEAKIQAKRGEITERRKLLRGESVNHSVNDVLWEFSKAAMNVPFTYDVAGEDWPISTPVIRELFTASMFVLGSTLALEAGPVAGVQNVVRRIKLGAENRKLRKLEGKLEKGRAA